MPRIYDISHSVVCFSPQTYCGHPRQTLFKYFGGGEIVVGHNHAPCNYKTASDVSHDLGGYHSRSCALLQRSMDGGKTWPEEDNVVVYDETMPEEKKKSFLFPAEAGREEYDMFAPDSLFFFGRTYLPEERGKIPVCFCLRSANRGRTWEKTPTIVTHPDGGKLWVHKDCHPVVSMPDGRTLLAVMSIDPPGGPGIYFSEDNGLSWCFLSNPMVDKSGTGRFTYAGLLLLPGGILQCYALHISKDSNNPEVSGVKNAICLSASADGGKTWTEPAPIVGKGNSCWKELDKREGGSNFYRSPWPIFLKGGNILVVFARRRFPFGMGGVVSSDSGRTWSDEFVIRTDNLLGDDLGYPIGCQLDDGRIFIAYYYNEEGKGYGTSVRYIAASHFRL